MAIETTNLVNRDLVQSVFIAMRPPLGNRKGNEVHPLLAAPEATKVSVQDQTTASGALKKGELSPQEQAVVTELQQRDREVRAHEAAHLAAGGPYITGGPTYSYHTGPDGRRSAVGGEVSIDTSPERTPEATIQKAEMVQRAALAPANPSPQDYAVAAAASELEIEGRIELQRQRADEKSADETKSGPSAAFLRNSRAGQAQNPAGQILDLVA